MAQDKKKVAQKKGDPKRYDTPLHGVNGVKRWMRWHIRNDTQPIPIKNPDKYLHSSVRHERA